MKRPAMPISALLATLPLLLNTCAVSAALAAPDPSAGTTLPTGYTYLADDTVRVATWNVEHFMDAYDDPYIDNPRENAPAEEMAARVERFASRRSRSHPPDPFYCCRSVSSQPGGGVSKRR